MIKYCEIWLEFVSFGKCDCVYFNGIKLMKFMNIDRWLLFLCKVIDFNVLGRCGKMVSEINVNNLEGGLYFEGYNSYFKEIK